MGDSNGVAAAPPGDDAAARAARKERKRKKKEAAREAEAREKAAGGPAMSKRAYEKELKRLQIELVKLQYWVKHKGLRVVLIFEGRDAAGKGGMIKRLTEGMNPRGCRVVALGTPSDHEKTQWYFQRYVAHLPSAGEIVIFDRSWYNRAGVEHVMGFCTDAEYAEFMRACPEFERMLVRSGIVLLKYWFSVSDEEQERRFRARLDDPMKRWKLSPMDLSVARQVGGVLEGEGRDAASTRTSRRRRGSRSNPTTRSAHASTACGTSWSRSRTRTCPPRPSSSRRASPPATTSGRRRPSSSTCRSITDAFRPRGSTHPVQSARPQ